MKYASIFLTLVLFSFGSSFGQFKTAMTYNLRYDSPNDGENIWTKRRSEVVKLLQHYSPEVVGTQEGMSHQLDYLDQNLTNYKYIGVGRDDGKQGGEYSAIFYNTSKLKVMEEGTFWLSETSDQVSKGWGANYNRVCTYGKFENKVSGGKFLVFNAHFDHESVPARENSAKLILKKIEEINTSNLPVIVMGDFNCTPETLPIKSFLKNLQDPSVLTPNGIYGPTGTYSGFDITPELDDRIDYILINGLKTQTYRHIDDRRTNGLWPSDHLPVMVTFE